MNALQILNYPEIEQEIGQIFQEGEPWFVANDLCSVLGLKDTTSATKKLDEDDRLLRKISGAGQVREVILVNESGMYNLIFTSTKPEARNFKRWITKEVLPQIRKTGIYVAKMMDMYELKAKKDRLKILVSRFTANEDYIEMLKLQKEVKSWEHSIKNQFFDSVETLFDGMSELKSKAATDSLTETV